MHVLVAAVSRFTNATGICKHAANIVKALSARESVNRTTLLIGAWQVRYFQTALGVTGGNKVTVAPVDIVNSSLQRNAWYLTALPRFIGQEKPDVVHLSFPAPILRRLIRCAVITTIHDLYPYDCPENFGFPNYYLNRLFLRIAVANSDGFVCVSDATRVRARELFGEHFAAKTNKTIYNVVDFSRTVAVAPERMHVASPFVLSVGQHRKNKNLELLIRAFSGLRRRGAIPGSLSLVLVGSPDSETSRLEALVKSECLESVVFFASSLSDAELCWLYQECQLFVAPSSIEGFCMPLAEARKLSKKILCSDIPVFLELAGPECSAFSLRGDAEQNLEDAMMVALQKPPSHPIGDLPQFSLEHIGTEYVNVYDSVTALADGGLRPRTALVESG